MKRKKNINREKGKKRNGIEEKRKELKTKLKLGDILSLNHVNGMLHELSPTSYGNTNANAAPKSWVDLVPPPSNQECKNGFPEEVPVKVSFS